MGMLASCVTRHVLAAALCITSSRAVYIYTNMMLHR